MSLVSLLLVSSCGKMCGMGQSRLDCAAPVNEQRAMPSEQLLSVLNLGRQMSNLGHDGMIAWHVHSCETLPEICSWCSFDGRQRDHLGI